MKLSCLLAVVGVVTACSQNDTIVSRTTGPRPQFDATVIGRFIGDTSKVVANSNPALGAIRAMDSAGVKIGYHGSDDNNVVGWVIFDPSIRQASGAAYWMIGAHSSANLFTLRTNLIHYAMLSNKPFVVTVRADHSSSDQNGKTLRPSVDGQISGTNLFSKHYEVNETVSIPGIGVVRIIPETIFRTPAYLKANHN